MQRKRILIIDDSKFDRALYLNYLKDENFEFDELDSGEKLSDYLFLRENLPDLVLLDWNMPGMDGPTTLKMLSVDPRYKSLPIVVITGMNKEEIIQEAFDHGTLDFLNKPVSKIELITRVRKVLELQQANKAIVHEKKVLKENLAMVMESASQQQAIFDQTLEERNRRLITMEVEAVKVTNQLDLVAKELSRLSEIVAEKSDEDKVTLLKKVRALQRNLEQLTTEEDSWADFKKVFETTNPDFFNRLLQCNKKITPHDLKHAAFIKMQMDNHEIAETFGIEMKSLQMSRYRLKKKLGLGADKSLNEFINSL